MQARCGELNFDDVRKEICSWPFSLIKASLLAFYSRFLISKKALWLLYFILGSLVAFTLGFILVSITSNGMTLAKNLLRSLFLAELLSSRYGIHSIHNIELRVDVLANYYLSSIVLFTPLSIFSSWSSLSLSSGD